MKYTKKSDKDKIRKAIKIFLIEKDFNNLKSYCDANNLVYDSEYRRLFRGHIDHVNVVRFVKKIEPDFTLVRYGTPGQEVFKIMKG